MSRRPTKPQLRRRSGAFPPTGSISLCLSRGASCPLLARDVPVPPHSRGPKARAGPTSRSPAWGPAPGCSGGSGRSVWLWGAGSVREPALLPLSSRRRSRPLPPLAGSSGGGPSRLCFGCLCFCDPCPPQPSRTRGPFCSAQPVAQTSPPARCDGPQLFARHRRPTSQTRKKCRGLKLTALTPRAPVPPIICIGIRLNHTGLCRFSLSFPLSAPSRSPRVLRRPDSQDGSLSRHSRAAR